MARGKIDNAVVKIGGCVEEGLSDIFILKFRGLLSQFIAVRICGCQFDDPPNGQTHVTNTGLTVHSCRVNGDSVQFHLFPTYCHSYST
jgi:hypothetical protein